MQADGCIVYLNFNEVHSPIIDFWDVTRIGRYSKRYDFTQIAYDLFFYLFDPNATYLLNKSWTQVIYTDFWTWSKVSRALVLRLFSLSERNVGSSEYDI